MTHNANTPNRDDVAWFLERLSVYICTFNEHDNIGPCVAAVRANGCRRVVVVDASPDERTAQAARAAGAEVLRAARGLASQRQRAVDHCQSEFLLFVDADDRLAADCAATLWEDMRANGYAAVQARLGVWRPQSYWQKAADALWRLCLFTPGPTNMVGRPALYRREALARAGLDVSFDGVGNEDAALSIRLERLGYGQGVGRGLSLRRQPASFAENLAAWRKYGRGDAQLIRRYPAKRAAVLSHLLVNYPLRRSWRLARRGAGRYAGYCLAMGLFRFFFMAVALTPGLSAKAKEKK